MPKSSTARREDLPESERSGIRSSVHPIEQRTTAKVPRVDLERLLAAERERAESDAEATLMAFPSFPDVEPPTVQSHDLAERTVERTVSMVAPRMVLSGAPSPIDGAPMSRRPTPLPRIHSDLPPEMPELTAVLKFTPVPIPPSMPAPSFEAMRAARDEARTTRYLVVGIWAFALSLAGSLGYVIATHG